MKKNIIVIFVIIVVIILAIGGYFIFNNQQKPIACTMEAKLCPDGSSVGRVGPKCEFAACPDSTIGWKTYTSADLSFEFKYPTTFNTKYASFSSAPGAVVVKQEDNPSGSCYVPPIEVPTKTQRNVVINGLNYCITTFEGVGAGQLYNTYYYTALKNGNYYTLAYVVHTLNGCSPYMDTPDYQPCLDFFKNYENVVIKPIQESVATLKFTK